MLAVLSNDRSDNLLNGFFERKPREELRSQIVATGFKTGLEELEKGGAIKRILVLEAAINARRNNTGFCGNSRNGGAFESMAFEGIDGGTKKTPEGFAAAFLLWGRRLTI